MPISPPPPSRGQHPASARIGALATLPVFFDLNSKKVLLIGGAEAASWKAELLAAAGANVEVHAIEFCAEMQALAARSDLNGSIRLVGKPWSLKAFANKFLIVGDAETESEAKAIFCAARAAGVPVNVIDKPAFCTFKFGSIVNRSPVVIGISTDGAAPVLGQAIRTRIEALLPSTLANWAQLAKDIRAAVLQRFAAGNERRQFWSRFARLAFGPFSEQSVWDVHVGNGAKTASGQVTVMKAPQRGPGMLTLNAVCALQGADAIYFDSRVEPAVLDHARREAARHEIAGQHPVSDRIDSLADQIRGSLKSGENILLVCHAGLSRTSAVCQLVSKLANHGVSVHKTDGHPASQLRNPVSARLPTIERADYHGSMNG
jgi:uroporphyrin-III C-methyltransferase / precorrin-2 dehydrogenase / sirohydrochlorin ferrochelatase